jgi:hypothetical protein
MAWRIISPDSVALGSQPIADVDTVKRHDLGTIVMASDPVYGMGEFIYLQTGAAVPVRGWVIYNADDYSVASPAANSIGPIAIAMSAGVASGYGWFQISGKALGKCLTLFADNGKVYLTGTAYTVDDTVVAGDLVTPATGASLTVPASGYAEFEIHRPFVNDALG